MAEPLHLQKYIGEGYIVLKAMGELAEDNCDVLAVAIRQASHTGVRKVILDIDGLTYLSGAGLGTLASEHRRSVAAGCQLILAGTNPKARSALSLSSLDKVIPTMDDLRDALAFRIPRSTSARSDVGHLNGI